MLLNNRGGAGLSFNTICSHLADNLKKPQTFKIEIMKINF